MHLLFTCRDGSEHTWVTGQVLPPEVNQSTIKYVDAQDRDSLKEIRKIGGYQLWCSIPFDTGWRFSVSASQTILSHLSSEEVDALLKAEKMGDPEIDALLEDDAVIEASLTKRERTFLGTGGRIFLDEILTLGQPHPDNSNYYWDGISWVSTTLSQPVGYVRPNGCGEITFRQAGHPENDKQLSSDWKPVYMLLT